VEKICSPNYKRERADYVRYIFDEGVEVEIISYYKVNEFIASCPTDHRKTVEKLLKMLKGTGIAKITIAFLDIKTCIDRKQGG